jgi:hypothetical protein
MRFSPRHALLRRVRTLTLTPQGHRLLARGGERSARLMDLIPLPHNPTPALKTGEAESWYGKFLVMRLIGTWSSTDLGAET